MGAEERKEKEGRKEVKKEGRERRKGETVPANSPPS
jgi:hypothetical protein